MDKNNELTNIKPELVSSAIKEGTKILKENDFFNELDFVMNDDNFRSFYSKYFKDFNDIKTVILYMKLYETIQKEYFERNNKDIERELLAYMIRELMNNEISRKHIFSSFQNFTDINNTSKKYLLDIFDNINNGSGKLSIK
jgi:hypothetical protein